MKKNTRITIFTLCFIALAAMASPLLAQSKSKIKKQKEQENKAYFDESGGFKHRLWYGVHFGGNFLSFSNNYFQIAPIISVGYKATDNFSFGLAGKIDYTYQRYFSTNNTPYKLSTASLGLGIFTRYKVFQNFFAHVEYDQVSIERAKDNMLQLDPTGKILKERIWQDHCYVGGGYRSGSEKWGYEIMLLYNLIEDKAQGNIPFYLRFGFTYKF